MQEEIATAHQAIHPYATQFRALVSTCATSARDNTGTTGTGVPIHWLNGPKVADDYADFYDGTWDDVSGRFRSGETGVLAFASRNVFTGSRSDGTAYPTTGGQTRCLGGTGDVRVGLVGTGATTSQAISHDFLSGSSGGRRLYALSPVFEVSGPTASFSAVQTFVDEGSGTRDILINVKPASATALTVNYRVSGTATAGSDYTTLPGTVTVAADATTATISVAITDDTAVEAEENIRLTLFGGEGYAGGPPSRHDIRIVDNDGGAAAGEPVASFASTHSEAREASGTHKIAVNLIPASSSPVTVKYSVGGTATPGVDYTALPGTVTVPANATTAMIDVAIIDDTVEDSDETVVLTLSRGAGYNRRHHTEQHLLIIVNRDPADPQDGGEDPGSGSALEGDIRERIDRTEANGDAHSNRIWRRALAAVRGEAPPDGLDAMTQSEAQRLADGHANGGRTELADLWQRIADRLGGVPDPDPEISISGGAGVTEGDDAVFTLTADPAPQSDLTVNVSVSQSGDFGVSTGSRTVTIPTGGSAPLAVSTVDDDADEPDGSVTATLNTGSGYTVSTSANAATVAVADDDDPQQQCVSTELHETVRGYHADPPNDAARARWAAVLQAFGDAMGVTAMTADEAQAYHDRGPAWEEKWAGIPEAIECLENAAVGAVVNGPLVRLTWASPRDGFGSPSASDYGVRVNGRASPSCRRSFPASRRDWCWRRPYPPSTR